jgi:predicted nucleotidyltransferase
VERTFDFERTEGRTQLLEGAVALLRSAAFVQSVEVAGSLSRGQADSYSDVDLLITARGVSDRATAEAVPGVLEPLGPRLVDGWALGLLPDLYVRTLYFDHLPLFWHLDVEVHSDIHAAGSDIAAAYHWQQIFKMWVKCAKDVLRGYDAIPAFRAHVERRSDLSAIGGAPKRQLAEILDVLAERTVQRGVAPETLAPLLLRCEALRARFLED